MISYTLKCKDGHLFDSWFGSAAAFEVLEKAGHLSCAVCGGPEVSKSLMAPRVAAARTDEAPARPLSQRPDTVSVSGNTASDIEKAVAQLRRKVEQNSEYVGKDFASEARAIHEGAAPERPIWGEARPDQARALSEDGVPVVPLPFRAKRKLT